MISGLIGYTGFVGGNILRQHPFDYLFNTSNIEDISGQKMDLLVCAGIPGTMWLANKNEDEDLANIRQLIDLVKKADVERLVLISTISVFKIGCEEQFENELSSFEDRLAYGKNRRIAEVELAESFSKCHIIRLPALFGPGLKKNFIYDMMNIIPKFLNEKKYEELSSMADGKQLEDNYFLNEKGFWELEEDLSSEVFSELVSFFKSVDFTALDFSNSSSELQLYNMDNIWKDINLAIDNDLRELNICSDPVSVGRIHKYLTGRPFDKNGSKIQKFNMKTRYGQLNDNDSMYLYPAESVLEELKEFYMKYKRI